MAFCIVSSASAYGWPCSYSTFHNCTVTLDFAVFSQAKYSQPISLISPYSFFLSSHKVAIFKFSLSTLLVYLLINQNKLTLTTSEKHRIPLVIELLNSLVESVVFPSNLTLLCFMKSQNISVFYFKLCIVFWHHFYV